MKMMFTLRNFFTAIFCVGCVQAMAQQNPPQPPPLPDSTMPHPQQPIKYNAGFDVIITVEGDIIYGLVKEVGEVMIRYQRTDIPDGPIYTIRRNEVYAISYRNQVKEYFSPSRSGLNNQLVPPVSQTLPGENYRYDLPYAKIKRLDLGRDANVRVGLGFIKSFTKVDEADELSRQATFPTVNISYDTHLKDMIRVGLMLGFGTRKFTGDRFSSYDSTNISSNVKENVFSLMVYGKYGVAANFANVRPYILGGIGINSSNVETENEVRFTNNPQALKVTSGGRSTGLGIIARVGADYFFNDRIGAYGDIGLGAAAVIQLGAVFNIQ